MLPKQFTPERIIGMLRKPEVMFSQGGGARGPAAVLGSRSKPITVDEGLRWLKVSQTKCLKELERKNGRIKNAVAELMQEKL